MSCLTAATRRTAAGKGGSCCRKRQKFVNTYVTLCRVPVPVPSVCPLLFWLCCSSGPNSSGVAYHALVWYCATCRNTALGDTRQPEVGVLNVPSSNQPLSQYRKLFIDFSLDRKFNFFNYIKMGVFEASFWLGAAWLWLAQSVWANHFSQINGLATFPPLVEIW